MGIVCKPWMAVFVIAAAIPLHGCHPPTQLTLKATPKPEWIEFTGTSSLPDGAQLLVGLYSPEKQDPIVQALPLLKSGKYYGRLKSGKLQKGSYRLVAEFSPRAYAWSPKVIPAVGKNGEHLHGPLVVRVEDGLRVLRLTQQLQIN